jgi:hypothetical protein
MRRPTTTVLFLCIVVIVNNHWLLCIYCDLFLRVVIYASLIMSISLIDAAMILPIMRINLGPDKFPPPKGFILLCVWPFESGSLLLQDIKLLLWHVD